MFGFLGHPFPERGPRAIPPAPMGLQIPQQGGFNVMRGRADRATYMNLIGGLGWIAQTAPSLAKWAFDRIFETVSSVGMTAIDIKEAYDQFGLSGAALESLMTVIPESLANLDVGAAAQKIGAAAGFGFAATATASAPVGLMLIANDLISYMNSSNSSGVPEAVKARVIQSAGTVVDDLGGEGAQGSAMASIVGEMFVDPPEINYEGLPQQTYSTGFPAHRGLRGVGFGAMQHNTDGQLVFKPGMRKSTAVTPYSANATMEKLNKRTTTPNVQSTPA